MDTDTRPTAKKWQSFWGLWNISFGFFGIQIGFALQNANMSRIFQSLQVSLDDLPILWIAAPLTGLLVQPIVGYYSDRTWTRLGRRRPYFLGGAILAALSLIAMPLAPSVAPLLAPLLFAALMLWVLDASLNISMEPFRAFVGDMLRSDQHTAGYAVQTGFIGLGAVCGSAFPYLLDYLGVANVAAEGSIPDTVRYSFWFGAVVFFGAVLWTVLTTREYSPAELDYFAKHAASNSDGSAESSATVASPASEASDSSHQQLAQKSFGYGLGWCALGALVVALVANFGLEKESYLLGVLIFVYGLLLMFSIVCARYRRGFDMLTTIIAELSAMPRLMRRLAVVQFFSWSALFIMWIYTTPVVTQYMFGSTDTNSAAYNEGANWVGILFATYNGIAALAAFFLLPRLAERWGKAGTHAICLLAGAAGFASYLFIRDPQLLLVSQVGIGLAWASILAMPYAMLASNLPQSKLGISMGIFNIFIVVPQLLVATVMGSIMKLFFPSEPIWTIIFGGVSLAIAALAMLQIRPQR